MTASAGHPFLESARKGSPERLRLWFFASYIVLLAGGYLRFETRYTWLGRLVVAALVMVLIARLGYYLWIMNRRIDARPPTPEEDAEYWAELREQSRARWTRLKPRGRAHYVWIMLRALMPLLVGPFFAILVLVGPAQLQFGGAPPVIVRLWGALLTAVVVALAVSIVQASRAWDRHRESWRQYASPTGS